MGWSPTHSTKSTMTIDNVYDKRKSTVFATIATVTFATMFTTELVKERRQSQESDTNGSDTLL